MSEFDNTLCGCTYGELSSAQRATDVIREVTATWPEPLDELDDIPKIVYALAMEGLLK